MGAILFFCWVKGWVEGDRCPKFYRNTKVLGVLGGGETVPYTSQIEDEVAFFCNKTSTSGVEYYTILGLSFRGGGVPFG